MVDSDEGTANELPCEQTNIRELIDVGASFPSFEDYIFLADKDEGIQEKRWHCTLYDSTLGSYG